MGMREIGGCCYRGQKIWGKNQAGLVGIMFSLRRQDLRVADLPKSPRPAGAGSFLCRREHVKIQGWTETARFFRAYPRCLGSFSISKELRICLESTCPRRRTAVRADHQDDRWLALPASLLSRLPQCARAIVVRA